MSRKTYCIASMKLTDVTALTDASLIASDNQSFGNIHLFKNETVPKDYGTLELNQFVLNGTKSIMSESVTDIAYMSSSKAQDDGMFSNSPKITISFTEPHTSAGITLNFGRHYPAEIEVSWYTLDNIKITSKTFYPSNDSFYCENQVENYGKIVISFCRMRHSDMYARLQYILYGEVLEWGRDTIKNAKLREEIDLTSATLAINTAEISIIDTESRFDIGNENGAWKSVQKTQEVSLEEYINGEGIGIGTFFVDSMAFGKNEASFGLIDRIGLMDKYQYASERMINKEKAGNILKEIFAKAGVTKYEISKEIFDVELTGYIPKQTCRAALQMICFVCGAIADTNRSDIVTVYRPERHVTSHIGVDRKFYGDSSVELGEYVSGVEIEYKNYVLDTEEKEIYKEILGEGETKIEFSEPYASDSLVLSKGTIKEATTDYAIVVMTEEAECVLRGKKYITNTLRYVHKVDVIQAGETENVKSFGSFTVYNAPLLLNVAEKLLEYYVLRKKTSIRYLPEAEKTGDWVYVKDIYGNAATTVIETQEIDLAGGYIARTTCRGYDKVVTDFAYIDEIYVGERSLI